MSASPTHSLRCHPACHPLAVRAIDVAATFSDNGGLALSYRISGDPTRLRIPEPQAPAPADDLWRKTCCEAFIAAVDGPEYLEFNFSPSGHWATYRFTNYRERDNGFRPASAPEIRFHLLADGFQLDAILAPALLPSSGNWHIGLSVVIESNDGGKSYWALAHAAPQPDFHLRQSFALTLTKP